MRTLRAEQPTAAAASDAAVCQSELLRLGAEKLSSRSLRLPWRFFACSSKYGSSSTAIAAAASSRARCQSELLGLGARKLSSRSLRLPWRFFACSSKYGSSSTAIAARSDIHIRTVGPIPEDCR